MASAPGVHLHSACIGGNSFATAGTGSRSSNGTNSPFYWLSRSDWLFYWLSRSDWLFYWLSRSDWLFYSLSRSDWLFYSLSICELPVVDAGFMFSMKLLAGSGKNTKWKVIEIDRPKYERHSSRGGGYGRSRGNGRSSDDIRSPKESPRYRRMNGPVPSGSQNYQTGGSTKGETILWFFHFQPIWEHLVQLFKFNFLFVYNVSPDVRL